jgi:glycosyltransferase involved in cell wall biosynthesis
MLRVFKVGMNIQDKYSAIITTYNCETTVESSIMSILSQRIPPFELIIVDDASTDSTFPILVGIASAYSHITLIRNSSNMGQSFGRNTSVDAAKSEYLIFFDDDDISTSSRAELHLEMFESGSDLNFVSSQKYYDEKYSTYAINKEIRSRTFSFLELLNCLLLGKKSSQLSFFIPACTLAITRSAFLRLNGFDIDMRRLEDVDLAIRAAKSQMRFSFSGEVGVCRTFTTGIDKGGGIDAQYESLLLEKYREEISFWSYLKAKSWQRIRRDYFERNWFSLFVFSLSNPLVWVQLAPKMKAVIGRFRHDRIK